jgi:FkbM family methyltransferase
VNEFLKSSIRRFLPKTVGKRRILAGPLKGFCIFTSWYDYPAAITGRTEKSLIAWFQENIRPGETWLDVGAHYGYTAIALSRFVGSRGRVFAFEPMLTTAGYLNQTMAVNGFSQSTVLPFALGQRENITIKQLPVERGMIDSTIENTEKVQFFTTNLDWLWSQINNNEPKIDGIKIDVQGMELSVLKGMIGILRKQNPVILLEFHKGADREKISAFLSSAGYQEPGIHPGGDKPVSDNNYLDNQSYVFTTRGIKS